MSNDIRAENSACESVIVSSNIGADDKIQSSACPECGSHMLNTKRRYWLLYNVHRTIPCICGASENGLTTIELGRIVKEQRTPCHIEADESEIVIFGREWEICFSKEYCKSCFSTCTVADYEDEYLDSEIIGSKDVSACAVCGYELAMDNKPGEKN